MSRSDTFSSLLVSEGIISAEQLAEIIRSGRWRPGVNQRKYL